MFVALKGHFTREGYDYFKYNKKSKTSEAAFDRRKDKLQFQILANRYPSDDLQTFYVANIVAGRLYVTDMLTDEAAACYQAFQRRQQSFGYLVGAELAKLEHIQYRKGQYPDIVLRTLAGEISWEAFIVANDHLNIVQHCDETLGIDDVIWSKVRLKALKLKPFLTYDRERFVAILDRNAENS
jgi:T4 gene Gp59 loader of gp41 DNA helicase